MESDFGKRGRFEILYGILSVCRKPAKKTSILYRCNLSYSQLQKYLDYLVSHTLLGSQENEGRRFFQITEKGKEFLDEYERLTSLLEEKQNANAVIQKSFGNGSRRNHKAI